MTVLAVTGLAAEARIAAAAGLQTICAGGSPERTAAAIDAAIATGKVTALVSFGIAGGLDPALRSGALVVASGVIAPDRMRYLAAAKWSAALRERAGGLAGEIFGAERIIAETMEKARLYRETAALAADLESLVVARAAQRAGLPFIVIRAIADAADRDLPAAALVPLTARGKPNLPGVLASLAAHPAQLPALIGLALATRRALGSLRGAAGQLHQER